MKEVRVGVRVTQLRVVHVETNSVLGPLTWLSIERGWPAYRIKFTVVSSVHVLSVCIVNFVIILQVYIYLLFFS